MKEPFAILKEDVENYFNELWESWYSDEKFTKPQLEIVESNEGNPYYDPATDRIFLPFPDGDIADYPSKKDMAIFGEENVWRIWKQALTHEMIHEFEFKVQTEPTEAGRKLRDSHKSIWPPAEKHGERFYSAIENRANFMGKNPVAFRDIL